MKTDYNETSKLISVTIRFSHKFLKLISNINYIVVTSADASQKCLYHLCSHIQI